MGGVLALVWKKTVQLGAYFVQEDFRHSGIGSQLFGLTIMEFEGHDYVFNSSKFFVSSNIVSASSSPHSLSIWTLSSVRKEVASLFY